MAEWVRPLTLLAQGRVALIVAQRLPLEEACRAHELLGRGGIAGKIVLVPTGAAPCPAETSSS